MPAGPVTKQNFYFEAALHLLHAPATRPTQGPAMTYLLPPLNGLRAFEAAARHLSFTRAAHELHVTPGAVAQQVRGLEAQLGFALFDRQHRQLALTGAGEAYLPPLRAAFSQIAAATDELRPLNTRAVVRLGIYGSHDVAPLMRRIAQFRAAEGAGVNVRVSRPAGFHELVEGKVNLVIDRRPADQPGYRSDAMPASGAARTWLIGPTGTADCAEVAALRDCLLAEEVSVPASTKDAMSEV